MALTGKKTGMPAVRRIFTDSMRATFRASSSTAVYPRGAALPVHESAGSGGWRGLPRDPRLDLGE